MEREGLSVGQVAGMIDHALLRPELTPEDVAQGCAVAARYQVASVCVRPADVALAAARLAGRDVLVGTVIGFPHGSTTTGAKAAEARIAVADGAIELDMVLNIGRLRGGDDRAVFRDIQAVVDAAHEQAPGTVIKVIFENAYLTDEEKIRACDLTAEAGADYVKTSTGFASSGATVEDVRLMRAHTPPHLGVKASGGIRTLDTLLAMVDAGATRIGTSSTPTILQALTTRLGASG